MGAAVPRLALLLLPLGASMVSSGAVFDEVTGAPLNDAARAMVAAQRESAVEAASSATPLAQFEAIPAVEVAEGRWKFVLLEISLGSTQKRLIVRALQGLRYHAENFDATRRLLRPLGVRCKVIGGGRIVRDSENRSISVYGYSKTFGRAPGANEKTAEILREHFPDYSVEWSDKGY